MGYERSGYRPEGRGGRRQLLLSLGDGRARDEGVFLCSDRSSVKASLERFGIEVGSIVSGRTEAESRQHPVGSGRVVIWREDGEPGVRGAVMVVGVGTAA